MAKWMTIKDALEELDLLDLLNEILESYVEESEDQVLIESELHDLLEEHEEEYEFVPDSDGDYSESFERNVKEALAIIIEEEGLIPEDDFSDDGLDDMDMDGIYDDDMDEDQENDPRGHGMDGDEYDDYASEDDYY